MSPIKTSLLAAVAVLTASAAQAQTTIITEPGPPAVITAPPAVVETDPLVLTPVQRRVIYRTIVQQPVVQRQVTVGAAPPPVVEYRVGTRLPAATTLYPLPQEVAVEVPAVSNYRYTVVNDRAWLVDPMTNQIVAEVAE